MNPVAPRSDRDRVRNSSSTSKEEEGGGAPSKGVAVDPAASWWTLPDIVEGGGDDGLSDVAVETLSACLHPVLEGLAALDAEVLLELTRKQPQRPRRAASDGGGGPVVREGVAVRPIHDDIEPPSHDPGAVRYLHLSEREGQYSMGIFVFPPHARIPLHDHPGMCVLSRVLYGDVHRLQLDLDRDQPQQQQQPQQQPHAHETSPLSVAKDDAARQHGRHSQFSAVGGSIGNLFRGRITPPGGSSSSKQYSSSSSSSSSSLSPLPCETSEGQHHHHHHHHHSHRQQQQPQRHVIPPAPGAKRAHRRNVDHLRAPQTTILFPFEGNLHEFVAGPDGAAVLDVLLPPYDVHHHRDCTFYEIYDDDDDSDEDDEGDGGANRPSARDRDDDGDMLMMMSNEGGGGLNKEPCSAERRVPCWIVPTGQPEDFHCISGRYRNLGTD